MYAFTIASYNAGVRNIGLHPEVRCVALGEELGKKMGAGVGARSGQLPLKHPSHLLL